jgi:membrane protein DedA with SNARE-associated domain
MIELYHNILNFLLEFSLSLSYVGTFLWMTVESSFIPWPSELLLIPQGILVQQGKLSFSLVLLAAILGSLLGALINYFLALKLGRALVIRLADKHGRFLFIDDKKILAVEKFFKTNGSITTFTGRLIPGIRQLISIPAGFAKMDLAKFSLYTALGSGIWAGISIILGVLFGQNQALIEQNLKLTTIIVVLVVILVLGLIIYKKRK